MPGKNVWSFAPFNHSAELRRRLAVPGSGKGTFDMVWRGKDGEEGHVLTAVSRIRNPRGEVSGVSLIARDIRERVADIRSCPRGVIKTICERARILAQRRLHLGRAGIRSSRPQ